jgi:UDP-glucose:(heptosyl)LPS alpha-1,3-glucosyltransferase
MKIAFVVHDYHQSGGHSRYVSELAMRFSADHEVHVFANGILKNGANTIQFHHVPAWRQGALTTILSFPLPATRQLNGDFDIIHAQGFCSLRADVLTAHICSRAWFEARRASDQFLSWKEVVFDRIVSPIEKHLYQNLKKTGWVIAISEKTHRELAEYYGREARTSVVYHGVDTERFTPASRAVYRTTVRHRLGLTDADFVFFFAGDLRKGAKVAIHALRHTPAAKLLLVSRTSPAPYREVAQELGISERVILCPSTDTIEQYYAAVDAFVFPTPYDAFGMVITEAMAAGLPVITTREAGAAELIDHQQDGLLVSAPSNVEEFALHMNQLISEPALCRSLGDEARIKMERYSWDYVADQTMAIYQRVLDERSK